MKKQRLMMIAAACAALAGGVGYAQTMPGFTGFSDTCFGALPPAKINTCSGTPGSTRRLIVPAQAYGYGWYNQVFVRASGNGSNAQTTCRAIGSNTNGTVASMTGFGASDFTQNTVLMPLGSVFVPTSGTLHFDCNVAHTAGRVMSVEF